MNKGYAKRAAIRAGTNDAPRRNKLSPRVQRSAPGTEESRAIRTFCKRRSNFAENQRVLILSGLWSLTIPG